MAKRGNIAFKFLMILSISAAILVLYPKLAETYVKGEVTRKAVAAREIALIIDTIYAYPYDITIDYDIELSGFTLEISDQVVTAYDSRLGKILDPSLARYRFFTTDNNNLQFKLESPKKIRFEKIKNKVEVSKI